MRVGRALVAALLVAAPGLSAATARGQEAPLASYCAPGSADASAAAEAVRAFGAAIDDPGETLATLAARYQALRALACFAPASDAALSFRSRAALRAWWAEGGLDWMWQFTRGHTPGAALEVVLPPDERPALSLEASPADHRLRALLCAEGDEACGRETAGWMLRAEAAFVAHAARERERARRQAEESAADGDDESGPSGGEAERYAYCTREATHVPPAERFPLWRGCVAGARQQTSALPVGRVRAPTRGWLVVRGRRGHYAFCDETRVYDLATGAAYVASSCSALALGGDGSVRTAETDAARRGAAVAGRLPVDALREAAWMLLLLDEVDAHHASELTIPLPIDVPTRFRADSSAGMGFGSHWSSSAQTRLAWAWVDGARVLAEGTLTWPISDRAAEDHAASLLRVAEAALTPGCVPAALPRGLALGTTSSAVSPVDADAASLRRAEDTVIAALRGLRAPRCRR